MDLSLSMKKTWNTDNFVRCFIREHKSMNLIYFETFFILFLHQILTSITELNVKIVPYGIFSQIVLLNSKCQCYSINIFVSALSE